MYPISYQETQKRMVIQFGSGPFGPALLVLGLVFPLCQIVQFCSIPSFTNSCLGGTIEIEELECVVGHVTRNNYGDSKW